MEYSVTVKITKYKFATEWLLLSHVCVAGCLTAYSGAMVLQLITYNEHLCFQVQWILWKLQCICPWTLSVVRFKRCLACDRMSFFSGTTPSSLGSCSITMTNFWGYSMWYANRSWEKVTGHWAFVKQILFL